MRKNFGAQTWICPMPVLIIGTYNEDGTPNAMNAAWGGPWDYNHIFICLSRHKTTDNIERTKAFTVSFADSKHIVEADYVGIVSGNNEPNKLAKANLHTERSKFVDAPIITDFPLTLECKLVENQDGNIVGEIVNVSADEKYLGTDGKPDPEKMHFITFDPIKNKYVELGKVVGNAFKDGMKIK